MSFEWSKEEINKILSAVPFEDLPIEEKIFNMAEMGCELSEIAIEVDLTEDELKMKYQTQLKKGRVKGLRELRLAQYVNASIGKSDRMLVHLGKTRLRQLDELIITNKSELDFGTVDLKTLPREELIKILEVKLKELKKQEKQEKKDES